MMLLDWLKERMVEALKPADETVMIDDDLYDWVDREQAALRARLQADRDLITRREDRPRDDRPGGGR